MRANDPLLRYRTPGLGLLYVAVAVFGTYLTFGPTFDSGFVSIQTERGDGVLNHLILENSWLALTDPNYCGTLATAPFCYPARGTIYFSENLFGTAPVYWALRAVLPLDLAYIWWQIVFCVLNFVTFAVVARWFRLPHLLAVGGAFLWAFAAVHLDQIKHQQMIARLWMPFGVYYAVALATEPSLKAWNRLLGSVFLQCLTCFYTGWFLLMGLAVFLPTLLTMRSGGWRELARFAWGRRGAVGGIALLWGAAMVALFAPYLVFNPSTGHDYSGCFGCLPTTAAWLTGPSGSRWEHALADYSYSSQPELGECRLFCGFGVYALGLAAALSLPFLGRERHPTLRLLTAAGLLTAAVWWVLTISTAPNGDSLWRWVRYLPGGGAVRVVTRVYVVVYLFGTLAGLAWLHIVTEAIRDEWRRGLLLAVVVAVLIWEQTGVEMPSFERTGFYPLVDRAAADLRGAEVGYLMPRYHDPHGVEWTGPYGEVFAMWVGMRANVPVVNGYSGVLPPGYFPFALLTDDQLRDCVRPKCNGRVRVRVIDPDFPDRTHEVVVE
jgi:hypothetical protein